MVPWSSGEDIGEAVQGGGGILSRLEECIEKGSKAVPDWKLTANTFVNLIL